MTLAQQFPPVRRTGDELESEKRNPYRRSVKTSFSRDRHGRKPLLPIRNPDGPVISSDPDAETRMDMNLNAEKRSRAETRGRRGEEKKKRSTR